jgi:hypothetical protein
LRRFCLGALLSLPFTILLPASGAGATTWTIPVGSLNASESRAAGPPGVPQQVTATCVLVLPAVTISWQSVASATAYVVLESTTSAAGPFNTVVGNPSGTSFTTGALSAGNYWFAVESQLGANWVSTASAATVESTIALSLVCAQL